MLYFLTAIEKGGKRGKESIISCIPAMEQVPETYTSVQRAMPHVPQGHLFGRDRDSSTEQYQLRYGD